MSANLQIYYSYLPANATAQKTILNQIGMLYLLEKASGNNFVVVGLMPWNYSHCLIRIDANSKSALELYWIPPMVTMVTLYKYCHMTCD